MSARETREKLKTLLTQYEEARVALEKHMAEAETYVDSKDTIRVRTIKRIIDAKKGDFLVANKNYEIFFKENNTAEVQKSQPLCQAVERLSVA